MDSGKENIHTRSVHSLKPTVSWLTYTLVLVFGVGSWVALNGIWVELPNLVNETPEGWSLASYLTIIANLANAGPILYTIIKSQIKVKKNELERITIFVILIIGFIACVLLACFWDKTTFILNKERSTALMVLTFLVALVDCTSSVTFLPFMSILPGIYMSPLYIGEIFTGLLPSLVALSQGVVDTAKNKTSNSSSILTKYSEKGLRFPQEYFFLFLALMMLMCFCAFVCLNYLPAIKIHHIVERHSKHVRTDTWTNDPFYESDMSENDATPLVNGQIQHLKIYSVNNLFLLLALMVWLNCLQNGILSSISSYACEPYGNVTYHLAATISSIAGASACFVFLWFPCKAIQQICLFTCSYTILSAYIVAVATQSPDPWLKSQNVGRVLIVTVSIINAALVAYSKLSIASIMRDHGHKYLFYAGVSNQVGSFIGGITMFPIVNYTNVFKQ